MRRVWIRSDRGPIGPAVTLELESYDEAFASMLRLADRYEQKGYTRADVGAYSMRLTSEDGYSRTIEIYQETRRSTTEETR